MQAPTSPLERRAHARIAVPLNVRVQTGKKEIELAARDISRSGVFLFSPNPPGPVGTMLTLRLSLTAGIKPVEVKAEIVRVVLDAADKKGAVLGFGAHFMELTPAEQGLLNLWTAMLGRGNQRRIYARVPPHRGAGALRPSCAPSSRTRPGRRGLNLDRPMQIDEEVALGLRTRGEAAEAAGVGDVPPEQRAGHVPGGLRFGRIAQPVRSCRRS